MTPPIFKTLIKLTILALAEAALDSIPKICTISSDFVDESGAYVKSSCIVYDKTKSYTQAALACKSYEMELYSVDSSTQAQLLSLVELKFGEMKRQKFYVKGGNGISCHNIENTFGSFVELIQPCRVKSCFICEYTIREETGTFVKEELKASEDKSGISSPNASANRDEKHKSKR